MNVKFKKALALSCAAVISTGMITVNAATITKTLKAEYHNIKVTYDGKLQSPAVEPFMVNGSVYVGLRDAGQMTNNTVNWDGANKTVHITSKAQPPSVDSEELAKKNLEIASLNSKIKDLEKKVDEYEDLLDEKKEEEENNKVTKDKLEDLLDDLDSDYRKQHSVSWNFDLDYDSKDNIIEFTVDYASKYDADDFSSISASSLEKFLKTMCEDIQDEFDRIKIEGIVIDSTTDETVAEFSMNEKKNFNLSRDYSRKAIRNFEDSLLKKYKTIPSVNTEDLKDVRIEAKSFYVEPSSDFDEVVFKIYTNFSADKATEWNKLENGSSYETRNLEYYLDDIVEEIESFFNASDIDGYIYNEKSKMMVKFEGGRFFPSQF